MVIFPNGFVSSGVPGYFIQESDQQVYSIKTGELRKLKKVRKFDTQKVFGWHLYLNGRRRFITESHVKEILSSNLKNEVEYAIPVR